MNRREAMLAALFGIGAADVRLDPVSEQHSWTAGERSQETLWVLKLGDSYNDPDEAMLAQFGGRMQAKWRKVWGTETPPPLIVLPPDCDLKRLDAAAQLPGNYAVHERIDDYEMTVTFQTMEEMQAWMAKRPVGVQLPSTREQRLNEDMERDLLNGVITRNEYRKMKGLETR